MMSIADLGAAARHILGMSKRSQGVSAAEVEATCFLSREEAAARLVGLAKLGHLQPIGRGRYVDAARIVAPAVICSPAPAAPAPEAPEPARLAPIGAPVRGEPAKARGGPKAWRPARPAAPLTVVPLPGVPEPVIVAPRAPLAGAVVIPPHVKVTRCPAPAYDARYQVDPSVRPFGAGFASAGIGRYLPNDTPAADDGPAVPPSTTP